MSEIPDYAEVDQALREAGAIGGGAEAHGLLCGLLCAAGRAEQGAWMEQLLKGCKSALSLEGSERLGELYQGTLGQLNDPELGFRLLLPGDDAGLEQRTVALSRWCEGFLFGLGAGGVTKERKLAREASEFLADLGEIARAELVGDEAEEGEEEAFAEIVEYLRMGVLMLNEELQPIKAPPQIH
jgi:uncharacterized protein YgfB (UPF0149 family)